VKVTFNFLNINRKIGQMAQRQVQGESPDTTRQVGANDASFLPPSLIVAEKTSRSRLKSDVDKHPVNAQCLLDSEERENALMTKGSGDSNSHESMRAIFNRQLNLQAEQSVDTVIASVQKLRRQFHEVAAAVLTPALNRYLEKVPQDTLEQKREVATHVNAMLNSVGLAVCSPGTHTPSTLIADWTKERKYSRFRFDVHLPGGGRDRVDTGCKKLEKVDLVENTQRVESRSARFRNRDPHDGRKL